MGYLCLSVSMLAYTTHPKRSLKMATSASALSMPCSAPTNTVLLRSSLTDGLRTKLLLATAQGITWTWKWAQSPESRLNSIFAHACEGVCSGVTQGRVSEEQPHPHQQGKEKACETSNLLAAGPAGGHLEVVLAQAVRAQRVMGAGLQQGMDRLLQLEDQVHIACSREAAAYQYSTLE